MKQLQFLFSVILIFNLLTVEASIHFYNGETFKEIGNAYILFGGSEGMVAGKVAGENAAHMRFNDGRSFIRFENITFWRRLETNDSHLQPNHHDDLIQAVIFEAADRDNIGGSAYGGQRSICCTPDLAKLEDCKQGEVLRKPSLSDATWPFIIDIHFTGDSLSSKMEPVNVYITKIGMYNLFFVSCNLESRGLWMNGKTLWKNPTGYLPGRMAPLMRFYFYMILLYFLLSVGWAFQYGRFWNEILQLQHCITAMIVLGFFEMCLWCLDYTHLNKTGLRPLGITFWVVTIGVMRKTLSRLIVLCLSMGYGVVRPTLGGLTSKVLLIGLTYLLASELLGIAGHVGTINDFSGKARLLLVLPIAFLDAFLILWIFTSLSKTLETLQAKRSTIKLDIYRKFTNALAVTVFASVAWIGYEIYFKATDPFNERWQSAWIITAFWDILSFALLCVICYLWAPSQNSQRYAYSDELGDEIDEEAKHLIKGQTEGDIGLVKQEGTSLDEERSFSKEDGEEAKQE